MEQFKLGDMVKSNFNGVISLVTQTGWEESGTVSLDCANNSGQYVMATSSEIENMSEGEYMALIGNPMNYAIRKIDPELFVEIMGFKQRVYRFSYDSETIRYAFTIEPPFLQELSTFNFFYDCAKWASQQGYDVYVIRAEQSVKYEAIVHHTGLNPFLNKPVYTSDKMNHQHCAMYDACNWIWENLIFGGNND